MKFLSLNRGPYWLRGLKYGVVVFFCLLFLLLIPLYGWTALVYLTVPLLSLIENIFGGANLLANFGFFALPNIYGWFVILIFLSVVGAVAGPIVGSFKNASSSSLPIVALLAFSSLFALVGVAAGFQPTIRCMLVFDGVYASHRSDCYLEALRKDSELAALAFCESKLRNVHYPECLRIVADYTMDVTICNRIPDGPTSEHGRYCHYSVSVRAKDPTLCENAATVNPSIDCVMEEADSKEGCHDFEWSSPNNSLCYLELIKRTGNPFHCRFVAGANKTLCIDAYRAKYLN